MPYRKFRHFVQAPGGSQCFAGAETLALSLARPPLVRGLDPRRCRLRPSLIGVPAQSWHWARQAARGAFGLRFSAHLLPYPRFCRLLGKLGLVLCRDARIICALAAWYAALGAPWRGLKVHLDGDEIVVRQRGTVFLIAFKKAPRQPRLIVTRNWVPNFASKPLAEFRASYSARSQVVAALVSKPGGARSSASFHRAIGEVSPALKLHRCSEPPSALRTAFMTI